LIELGEPDGFAVEDVLDGEVEALVPDGKRSDMDIVVIPSPFA